MHHHDDNQPADAESIEAAFMYALQAYAPEPARELLGIATTRLGGGVVLAMRNDSTKYWSKALGFGVDQPVTADLIAQVLDFYRAERSDHAVLQIAPSALPDDWTVIRDRYGLREGALITKLSGPADAVPPARTDLRIGPVPPEAYPEWASVLLGIFGMPEEGLAEAVVTLLGRDGFQPFAAWDGDRIVAGGNLYVEGDIGSLHMGATLPSHRQRGAQSALVEIRARAAAAAGCRWLVSETGTPGPGEVNHSRDNMLRAGLRVRYLRRNWIWEAKNDPTTR